MRSLGEKQEAFAKNWGRFLTWFHSHPTWRMRMQEGYVGDTDAADGDYDGPHMKGGAHYLKIGIDFAFFVLVLDQRGIEVSRTQLITSHPFWNECGTQWKSYDPDNRWGGDFTKKDYNHFSMIHEGKM
jgi:hypothetical protein